MTDQPGDGGLKLAELTIICRQTHTETNIVRNPAGLTHEQLAEQLEFTARHLRNLPERTQTA